MVKNARRARIAHDESVYRVCSGSSRRTHFHRPAGWLDCGYPYLATIAQTHENQCDIASVFGSVQRLRCSFGSQPAFLFVWRTARMACCHHYGCMDHLLFRDLRTVGTGIIQLVRWNAHRMVCYNADILAR